jgi:hypothetical protein
MTGEAQILGYRRSAENPPQRHRDRRDDHEFDDEPGFDFILGALCVSVVKNSREGCAELDLIMQNKANFQRGKMDTNCLIGKGLWEFRSAWRRRKTNPIKANCPRVLTRTGQPVPRAA